MSRDSEEKSSQASLGPPVEIVIPSTPTAIHTVLASSADGPELDQSRSSAKPDFLSQPRSSSSEMTPPPSSQNLRPTTPRHRSRSTSEPFLASPPATIDQTLCVAYGASEDLPTTADIEDADEGKLRNIAKELLVFAQEFRMSAAHFKLQHSLLSLTSGEAVKRAEVEHQLARREVEILQSDEYRNRHRISRTRSPAPAQDNRLEGALKRIKELEQSNATLDRRLRRAKKFIEDESDKHELLLEENKRLKQRIRDNREHFTLMLDHGSLASSPRTEFNTPQQRPISHFPQSAQSHVSRADNQDAFATLIAAGQAMSGETATVHSTPSRNRATRYHPGHTRGTHSMSSLPVTPQRSKASHSQRHFFTPINRRIAESPLSHSTRISHEEDLAERHRHDRDSTISDDEAVTDEDVPASQASSLATSMLRKYPGSSQEDVPIPANIGKSSSLLQSKLFGQVKKAGVDRSSDSLKRKASYGNIDIPLKKVRGGKPHGLGIRS
ncbi:hypothetical protein AJ80_07130 [Polytolypa hystricis UAMH7299]|uniref:Uncharacterized protein n=1 Tax=Polytolypa hystricis (strain UAMH7299) TaxID=1447883 RepID=A0A2B7XR51_POLH7|nr:hypothetical protein AJ80_07130 [Polytolypa hystricis UAMH7299]